MAGDVERRAYAVLGIVQGVGFRPFVHALATRLDLRGFVANRGGRVEIEVEGSPEALARFEQALSASAPPLARLESITARVVPVRGDVRFEVAPSRRDGAAAPVFPPDAATCGPCLAELFDPHGRRYRYPFITCTACGPRLTVVTGSPYDRERTTMAAFAMCAACRAEYEDPADRRFHAETIACAACGPSLRFTGPGGLSVRGDPIVETARALGAGGIVAVKGLGGFHLACAADDPAAVRELRRRKHRDDKPFAVMVGSIERARELCEVSPAEAALLEGPAAPIVLLRIRSTEGIDAAGIAPHAARLGLFLPYTPVHHLLLAARDGRPMVLTSGNLSDEPIATGNTEALTRLGGVADAFLLHDRAIHVRCDDSVVRQARGEPILVRRSRGYAPSMIALPFACDEPILAVGGQLKNTFAMGHRGHAILSHYIGDLDDLLALDAFERDLRLYEELFDAAPRIVAHDLHPDYASTRLALARPGVRTVGVQHHHAHLAACLAEHGVEGPAIGIIWDGAGWGPDGTVWGGEFLVGDRRGVRRAGHFRGVRLPGGDAAVREPWRMALAYLLDAGQDAGRALARIPAARRAAVERLLGTGFNSPVTSSVGRLFDAVAALCAAVDGVTFEGQAAMRLEALAEGGPPAPDPYPFSIQRGSGAGMFEVDTRPLVAAVEADCRAGAPAGVIAGRFHAGLARIARAAAVELRDQTGISRVACSGGVFLNGILTGAVQTALVNEGFQVYCHHMVSPGDGGLCLGQLAVAATAEA